MASLRSALAVACTGVLLLSACSAAPAASPSAEATPRGGRSQQARMNGTYGLIADISGATLQVQGQSGQTAVTYTDATSITQQKAGTTADLVAGACVTIRGEEAADASGGLTAQTIAVTPDMSVWLMSMFPAPLEQEGTPAPAPVGAPSLTMYHTRGEVPAFAVKVSCVSLNDLAMNTMSVPSATLGTEPLFEVSNPHAVALMIVGVVRAPSSRHPAAFDVVGLLSLNRLHVHGPLPELTRVISVKVIPLKGRQSATE